MISSKKSLALKILLGLAVATQGIGSSFAYAEEGEPEPNRYNTGQYSNVSTYYSNQTEGLNIEKTLNGSEGEIFDAESDMVVGHTIELQDGDYSGKIFMAKAVQNDNTTLNVSDNTINIKGGNYGSWTEIGAGAATYIVGDNDNSNSNWSKVGNGTINLFGGTFADGVTLRGDTLNVYNKDLKLGHIANFNRVNFFVPSSAQSGDTMLTLTLDGYDSTSDASFKPDVAAYFAGDSAMNQGDSVNLLHIANDTHGSFANFNLLGGNSKAYMGVSKEYGVNLFLSDDKKTVSAILTGITEAKGDISKYYNEQVYLTPTDYLSESSGNKIISDESEVTNKVVFLSGGTFTDSIFMADKATDVAKIENNTISILDGDFTGISAIGSGVADNVNDDGWAKVGNGTVNLFGGTFGQNTILKGGTLNVFGKDLSVGHLASFNTINFFAPENVKNNDTLLTLTGNDYDSLQYLNSNVNAYFNGNSDLKTGDSVKLLTASGEALSDFSKLNLATGEMEGTPVTSFAYVGVSKKYYTFLSTTEDKKSIVASLVHVEGGNTPPPSGDDGDNDNDNPPEESPTKENDDLFNKINGRGEGIEGVSANYLIETDTAVIERDDTGNILSVAMYKDTPEVKGQTVFVEDGAPFEGELAVADTSCGTVADNLIVISGGTFKDSTVINAGKLTSKAKAADEGNGGSITLQKGNFGKDVVLKADTVDVAPLTISEEIIITPEGGGRPQYDYKVTGVNRFTLGKLSGVKNLNFWINENNKSGDTLLTLTDAKPLDTDSVSVKGYMHGSSQLKAYDQIKLLTLSNPQANLNNVVLSNGSYGKAEWYNGVSTIQDVLLTKNDNSIVATVGATPDTLRYETKALAETNMASIASINNNADVLVDMGYSSAAEAIATLKNADSSAANTFAPYAAIGYSKLKQNSGSYVNTKGVGFNIGFAKEISSGGSKMIFGPFVEYGRGSYDSHLEDQCDTRGDGKTRSVGIGAMIRSENNDGMYYEGSLRFGRVTTDFDSVNMVPDLGIRCQYDTTNNYYGAHVGIGKVLNLSDKSKLDVYGKLFLTQMEGHTVHLSTGENYEFDNVNSIRSRLGFRYTTNIGEKSKFYGGLAWQHEFDGTSNATYLHPTDPSRNLNTPSPSVKGNTAMLELGVLLANSDNFSVDLGLRGYAGKQQGSAVNARFNWTF